MRVLYLPYNIANTATLLSQELRKLNHKSAVCEWYPNPYGFKADYQLKIDKPFWRLRKIKATAFFLYALPQYDVFHFATGKSFIPDNNLKDLSLIRKLGKKVVMQYYGTDVRRMSIYAQINGYAREAITQEESLIIDHLQLAARYIDTVVVYTPELKLYVEEFFERVELIPIPVSLDNMKPLPPDPDKSEPLVVHAPSNRTTKGTKFILEAVERLKAEGKKINFKLVEGMSYTDAINLYREADIIVDQVVSSTYGGLTIESMALAKPVICSLNAEMQQQYWSDIPVINATPDTIYHKLKGLIDEPKLRYELGVNGRDYVEKYHSSIDVAKQLIKIYGDC